MTKLERQLTASVEALDSGGRFVSRAELLTDDELAEVHRQLTAGAAIVWVPADWFEEE